VVLVAVKDDPEVLAAVQRLQRELEELGVRLRVDRRTEIGLGRRLTDWELKGVPVRLEVGPRDLATGTVSLVRRDGAERVAVALDAAAASARDVLAEAQAALLAQARSELERRTIDVDTLEEALEVAGDGFARIEWAACGLEGERRANAAGVTVRCLMRADGSMPDTVDEDELIAVLARAY
jgi:prolyl-tRNA synthetase